MTNNVKTVFEQMQEWKKAKNLARVAVKSAWENAQEAKKNSQIALRAATLKPFWNIEKDGSEFSCQADTLEQAWEIAQNSFEEQVQEEDAPANGQTFEADVVFIRYQYDASIDDYKIVERIEDRLIYEHYHGDYAEHNTMGER